MIRRMGEDDAMRYPASEKLEVIRLVECHPHLPIADRRWTSWVFLARTFYRWYEPLSDGGPEALEDQSPQPSRRLEIVIPDDVFVNGSLTWH